MTLSSTLAEYTDAWSEPDRNPRRAFELVDEFCNAHPKLDHSLTAEFAAILRRKHDRWFPQLFVANVLARIPAFDRELMEPMLQAAVEMPDPSTNRDFLTPCLCSFGADDVVAWLVEAFSNANFVERVGIANLVYWLRSYPVDMDELRKRKSSGQDVDDWLRSHDIDTHPLRDAIQTTAKATRNLVELYFYSLALPDRQHLFAEIPKDAVELEIRIAGHADYERLLYDELGWPRCHTGRKSR